MSATNSIFYFHFSHNNNTNVLVDVHIEAGQPSTAQRTSSAPPEYEQAEELGGHGHLYTLPTTTEVELPVYARIKVYIFFLCHRPSVMK